MIIVYFETENGSYSEIVATFNSEEIYIEHLPLLEAQAKRQGFIVTESMESQEIELNKEILAELMGTSQGQKIWNQLSQEQKSEFIKYQYECFSDFSMCSNWNNSTPPTHEEVKAQILLIFEP